MGAFTVIQTKWKLEQPWKLRLFRLLLSGRECTTGECAQLQSPIFHESVTWKFFNLWHHKAKKYFLSLCFHIYVPITSSGRFLLPLCTASWIKCYSLLNEESVQNIILLICIVQKYAFIPVWKFVSVLSPLLSQEAGSCMMVVWWIVLCGNAKWEKIFFVISIWIIVSFN